MVTSSRLLRFENRGYRLAAEGGAFSRNTRHPMVTSPRLLRFGNRGYRLAAEGRLRAVDGNLCRHGLPLSITIDGPAAGRPSSHLNCLL